KPGLSFRGRRRSGLSAEELDLGFLLVLPGHFVEDDRVPGELALAVRNVVLARPAAQPKFLDEIQFHHYTRLHKRFLTERASHAGERRQEKYSGGRFPDKQLCELSGEIALDEAPSLNYPLSSSGKFETVVSDPSRPTGHCGARTEVVGSMGG